VGKLRALDQITILPSTPTLRRDEIKLQVALITPIMYVKGLCCAGNQSGRGAAGTLNRADRWPIVLEALFATCIEPMSAPSLSRSLREATLWRQSRQILLALDALDRRKPQERTRFCVDDVHL
jgi:hypothetical protein